MIWVWEQAIKLVFTEVGQIQFQLMLPTVIPSLSNINVEMLNASKILLLICDIMQHTELVDSL